jgi:hypothetical protein
MPAAGKSPAIGRQGVRRAPHRSIQYFGNDLTVIAVTRSILLLMLPHSNPCERQDGLAVRSEPKMRHAPAWCRLRCEDCFGSQADFWAGPMSTSVAIKCLPIRAAERRRR